MSDQPSLVDKLETEQSKTQLRSTLSPWGQQVAERVLELRDGLQHVDPSQRDHLGQILDAAEWLAFDRVPLWRCITRLSDWWFGGRVERAWSLLHEAEVLFVEYADDRGFEIALETALGHAAGLPADDPVRLRFEEMLQSWPEQASTPAADSTPVTEPAEGKR